MSDVLSITPAALPLHLVTCSLFCSNMVTKACCHKGEFEPWPHGTSSYWSSPCTWLCRCWNRESFYISTLLFVSTALKKKKTGLTHCKRFSHRSHFWKHYSHFASGFQNGRQLRSGLEFHMWRQKFSFFKWCQEFASFRCIMCLLPPPPPPDKSHVLAHYK